MNAVILTQAQYQALIDQLEEIKKQLIDPQKTLSEQYLDNADFIKAMRISSRTAQNWRDEGRISFSQIGKKIYYKVADIETFIDKYHRKAFNPKRIDIKT